MREMVRGGGLEAETKLSVPGLLLPLQLKYEYIYFRLVQQ